MDDLISREAATEGFESVTWHDTRDADIAHDVIGKLSSAQPEIIRCKDCRHWREGTSYSYCFKLYAMGVLNAYDHMVAEDDFCSKAERREE